MRTQRIARAVLLSLAMVLIAAGGATLLGQASPAGEEAEGASDGAPPSPKRGGAEAEWLVDEAGRRYRLEKIAKPEDPARWSWDDAEQTVARIGPNPPLKIDSHDDEFFYFRWYAPPEAAATPAPAPSSEREEILASFGPAELPQQDALRFEDLSQGLPQAGQWRNGFEVADMNRDGHPDIVFGPARKGRRVPVVLLGDGEGGWSPWMDARYPDYLYEYGDVAVGDLNGDGWQDIVLGMHVVGLYAMVQDPKRPGTFEPWADGLPLRPGARRQLRQLRQKQAAEAGGDRYDRPPANFRPRQDLNPDPRSFSSRGLNLADWNGDGRLDIVALSEGPSGIDNIEISSPAGRVVFLNQGDGSWRWLTGPGPAIGDELHVADLDGDGRPDAYHDSRALGSGQLVMLNTWGDPAPADVASGEGAAPWRSVTLPDLRPVLLVNGVAAGDFDGDGALDLVVAYVSQWEDVKKQGIDLYSTRAAAKAGGDGGERWARRPIVADDDWWAGASRLAGGDLDGDGDRDLVVTRFDGDTWVLVNEGRGSFVRELAPELEADPAHVFCRGYDVQVVDVTGDGRGEIVASFAGESGSNNSLLVTNQELRCPAGGAIRVWKVEPRIRISESAQ